ncbi:hypothetical protein [Deinococcus arenicola]|uniref:Uncharacterized protein n=1 Tax=Deinococcus arenicola TaxID=2994950 RepID=A0ABU4DLL5_9DEIO|nr:hypothetical protein [Deinococcus sp. ZS9-10]MDV6373331.1 hypothetical protein [Deinococcus sp. ZS9-10]
MKPTLALMAVSALLLASCNRTDTTPVVEPTVDPATMAPAAPVVGQAVELQQVPGLSRAGLQQLAAVTNPSNPDLDPDLKTLLALFGSKVPQYINPTGIGTLVQGFGGQSRVTAQALNDVQDLLPTGTVTYAADGTRSYAAAPTDGYVEIDQRNNTRIEAKWKVGGAATVLINSGTRFNPQTNQLQQVQQEVPTNAAVSLSAAGKVLAALAFKMTPGACVNLAGPTALSLSGWAGRDTNSPARVSLDYAWTDQKVSLSASALYRTTTQKVSSDVKLDIAGTTSDRCGTNFTFTPTRANVTGTLDIPSYKTDLTVYLRNLSNLTINASTLKAQNPFAKIGGTANASLTFNDKPVMTAFGPLADGTDMNLQPGDQVLVQYVKNGQLVKTDVDGAVKDVREVFGVPF